MHAIASSRRSLAIYLAVWILVGCGFGAITASEAGLPVAPSLLLALFPTLIFGLLCLAAWYPARAMPLERTPPMRLAVAHVTSAVIAAAMWVGVWRATRTLWAAIPPLSEVPVARPGTAILFGAGIVLYLLATSIAYLILSLERARDVETRHARAQLLAREAELASLRAQLDPHFLFNSLNSVSALCSSDPAAARAMTQSLADYFRSTLRAGGSSSITLGEELSLASDYLGIEHVRFGSRLRYSVECAEVLARVSVPPLLLQPLVENAVRHGVAHLVEGGEVRITVRELRDAVEVRIENPCDPDRPGSGGPGIGLANVRRRLAVFFGQDASLSTDEEPERFRVTLVLPVGR